MLYILIKMVVRKNYLHFAIAFSLTLVLFTSLVLAAGSEDSSKNVAELQKAYDHFKCKNDITVGYYNIINGIDNSSVMTSYSDELNADLAELQIIADNGSRSEFRKYITSNYNPDLLAGNVAALSWWTTKRTYLNKTERADLLKQLIEGHKSLNTTYDTCVFNALKNYGDGRVTSFNAILEGYQKRINELAEKNVSVESLNKILEDARTQVVQPLQTGLAAANTSKQKFDALKSYCLYDGCFIGTNAINFHLAAKFEIAKLNIALAKIKENPGNTSLEEITKFENYITQASLALNNVGTKKYTPGTKVSVWDPIHLAYKSLLEIKKSIK
jgi:hypothetical protein